MAQNITLLGASYSAVPAVQLPKTGGGSALFYDTTISTNAAAAGDIANGKQAYVNGSLITGTATGGGGSTAEPNDVTFYDYDGTVVASYTAADFANLSALPANPSHTGLTAQGWNWSLPDAKTYVATYGKLDIGQMYITDDGKTRLYIEIPDGAAGDQLTFYVRYTQSVANGVTVDWGDGSTPETYSETTYAVNGSHTYTYPGKYIITLKVTSGTLLFDEGTTSNAIYGSTSIYYNRTRIYKAEIGSSVSSIGYHAFGNCHAMKVISLPSGITSINTQAFNSCYILNFISIPSSVTSTGNYGFQYCYALKAIALPKSVSSIGTYSFRYCYSLKSIALNVSSINNYALQYCCNIASIIIPQSVTSIGNSALTQCYGMAYIKMLPTAPPTLGTSNFTNMTKCIIYVPYSADHSVLAAYKTASNWSSFASQMVETPAS